MSDKITIAREHLPAVIARAFDLSDPQGLGHLHFKDGSIPESTLNRIVQNSDAAAGPYRKGIRLDYVEGRAVKLSIFHTEEDGYYLEGHGKWFDHSEAAWADLTAFIASLHGAAQS